MKKLLLLLLFVSLIFSCGDVVESINKLSNKSDRSTEIEEYTSYEKENSETFNTDGTISEELSENNRFITENKNQPLLVNDEYKSNKDCYIVNVSAMKTEESARKKVEKLKNEGYESGFLWIPNFSSLSGAEYYSVFIGPFGTQLECEQATEDYRKINPKAYGLLVSQNPERVEIRGLGKVKIINE